MSGYYSLIFYEKVIKPEHVILAMLADKRSHAGSYLRAIGMTYTDFESELKPVKKKKLLGIIGGNSFLVQIGFVKFVYDMIIRFFSNHL
nr:Clp protease N-terminal domain-containing protein [Flavobacterium sp. Sd200]